METSDGKRVGLSKVAAREGITMVTLSRYIESVMKSTFMLMS